MKSSQYYGLSSILFLLLAAAQPHGDRLDKITTVTALIIALLYLPGSVVYSLKEK